MWDKSKIRFNNRWWLFFSICTCILIFFHLANLSQKIFVHSYFLDVHRTSNFIPFFYFWRYRKIFSTFTSVNTRILYRFNYKFTHLKLLKLLDFLHFFEIQDFFVFLIFSILFISIKHHLNILFIVFQFLLLV